MQQPDTETLYPAGMGSTIADIRQTGIDSKIQLVKGIMENYHEIFDTDIQWCQDFDDMDVRIEKFKDR